MTTVPVEQFAAFISVGLYNTTAYHEQIAKSLITSTHTMLSWSAQESTTDILTGEKRYAIVAYAHVAAIEALGGER